MTSFLCMLNHNWYFFLVTTSVMIILMDDCQHFALEFPPREYCPMVVHRVYLGLVAAMAIVMSCMLLIDGVASFYKISKCIIFPCVEIGSFQMPFLTVACTKVHSQTCYHLGWIQCVILYNKLRAPWPALTLSGNVCWGCQRRSSIISWTCSVPNRSWRR